MVSSDKDENGAATARRTPRVWSRFVIMLVATIVIMMVVGVLNASLSGLGVLELVIGIGSSVAVLLCYERLSKRVERRETVPELARTEARSGLLRGTAIGAVAFLATMLVILIFGGWDGVEGGSLWGFLATTGIMACTAVTEEVVFRGVLFRFLEERAGTWLALGLSAVIFGGAHLASGYHNADPAAMLWGSLAIAVEAGLMLGAAYVASRTLWLPIGLHFAWNLSEAGVFGTAVSGTANEFDGLLHTSLSGPSVLTGGTFGPEASLIAMLTCAVPAVILLRKAMREGRIVRRGGAAQSAAQSAADTNPTR
ncbi:CPBP family intramembrane glutamic endopeptidase [Sphaerisporangium corydalis]|uniref:CPBP family intramembrane glutamic endopeptidase n=1 Tax=Sphaerisporangium corydalis TaxID=1441875 RepID=A0ABV9EVF4_9ACTN|nr:type II CAAX endopeptidase family protein [Sphaerisporangium corydalis]